MRINGQNHPLYEVAAWGEGLWETYAYLARGARSRQPALVNALPRLRHPSPGVQDSSKDFNATEMPLNGFIKPEPYLTGELGHHCPGGRRRTYQSSMGCHAPWIHQEQAEH
jgi:hypothetical protein